MVATMDIGGFVGRLFQEEIATSHFPKYLRRTPPFVLVPVAGFWIGPADTRGKVRILWIRGEKEGFRGWLLPQVPPTVYSIANYIKIPLHQKP